MMNWFTSKLRRQPASAVVAKHRLKMVLQIDRSNLTPELLGLLQEDIVRVISQRVDIDRAGIKVTTERDEKGDRLIADIPIRAIRHAATSE